MKKIFQKVVLTFGIGSVIITKHQAIGAHADMAELADALDSGSSEVTLIQVQVLLSAPWRGPLKRGGFAFA